ncbi:MAG: dipeptide ABC transporter ATP-binding protein [Devosiaceae bacterium]|nr:dipeptide ABC transporter ATP-binding protein [Devosiaceae bacterium]
MKNLLTIKDLSLNIGETKILQDIDLEVNGGEILGVIGESGSGKSMSALAIMQLAPGGAKINGSIKFKGEELLKFSEKQMCELRGSEIGMIFQEPMSALNPVKTIGEQVAETVLIHSNVSKREAQQIAREVLERVELPSDEFPLNRFPHQLSGGQRQRVVIAMAIAHKPALLIADEPTTALDVTTQAQILKLLEKLVEEDGMGLILITHDLAVVAEVAKNVVIMQNGIVVEAGETLEVFSDLKHPYSKQLFAASNHVPKRVNRAKPDKEKPVLRASNILRQYPGRGGSFFKKSKPFTAVDKVSFYIAKGENVGLVGESGCGKSTLSRALLALDIMQGGIVHLDGETISAGKGANKGASRAARRKMQVVFQDPYGSFNPRHRVEKLVAEPFYLLDDPPRGIERRQRVEKALIEVGLNAADADKYIHEFSGGQRQRVAIARALIIEPALIILDEAVSALDVSIRAQILDLLAQLSDKRGISYLFISHDLSVVRAITDRVLVMRDGVIVEEGESQSVFANPQHPYTKQLLGAVPDIEKALAARRMQQA